jgi:hypothetical protein
VLAREQLVAIDVWGLGALAYDLLGGGAPWGEPGPQGGIAAWERAASEAVPPELAGVPPRLARVIAKAMALDPTARYGSAAEVGDELDAYLARRPTSLDRARPLRAWLWCRRNPQLSLTAAAAVVLATLTLASYWTVVKLRARSRALDDEVAEQETANRELAVRVANTRREAVAAEAELRGKSEALAHLQRELADEESSYRAIIAARDKALKDADAATKQLVEQLTIARSDRQVAELGRSMYEGFWSSARHEADKALADRDQAQKERDGARTERDQMQKDRDGALSDRDRARADFDHAKAELERLTAAAAASAARIAALEREIAGGAPRDAGAADAGLSAAAAAAAR